MVHEGFFDSRIVFPAQEQIYQWQQCVSHKAFVPSIIHPFLSPSHRNNYHRSVSPPPILPSFLPHPFRSPSLLTNLFPLSAPPPLKPFGPLLRKTVSSIPVSCSPPSSSPARIPRLPFVAGRPPPCLGSVVLRWGGGGRRQVSDRGERQGPSTTATLLPGGDGGGGGPPFSLLFLVVAKQP